LTSGKIKSKPGFRGITNYILSLVLTAAFLYIAFYGVDFNELYIKVSEASVFWIAAFIIVQLAAHYIRAVRWQVILRSVKPDAKLKHLFGAVMVGYGVNCVVPRLGELSRAVLLGKWEGLSRSSMFGSVVLERIIDLIFLGFAVIVSIMLWRENLFISFPWLEYTLYITVALIACVIFFFYLAVRFKEKFYNFIIKFFSRLSEKSAHKIAYIISMFGQGFSSLKGLKNYIVTFSLSALIMLLYALSSYFGFFIVGMQPVDFQMGWIIMSISAIGVVIPTPGGTGSYHYLAKTTLVSLFGFVETISLAYAFITHIVTYFLFIFTALIVFFILNKQHNNLINIVETKIDES
jgi:glycosyltransferase 2 family protein